ncbi:receptor protein kinase-like protein ZAR1 [Hibiscus syriacus]|uniref:receptor protein kinase-like protein ZAR1 n=1 Tax=Hibiscus syriacus TaxID=106335 RepID=UPI0019224D53|nr:receptor protein kinase-like protein ZAR1 [Hibiscus syriacus]
MKKLPLLPLFFVFLLRSPKPAFSLSPDGLSLLSLKSAVDQSSGQSFLANWNEDDATPCNWSGISCKNVSGSADPRVVGIAVSGKNIRGYIPSELGNLIYLRRLNLHNNDFYGSIPDQLFNATSLHSMFLYGNNLSGPLPPSICKLPKLQNLDLSNNSLSGSLPENLRNCKQLQRLILAQNKFSGEIPDRIWPELDNLIQLDLSSNEFNGPIPSTIGELNSLSGTLNLSYNHLSGNLPKSLGDLPVIVSFDLRHNNLSGEIPETGSFANQGPTAFLNNPLLCGFPLQKTCKNSSTSSSGTQNSGPNSGETQKKGLTPGLIILISAADAVGVALIGLIIVYIYWKNKDSSNGCSCTGKAKFGDNYKGKLCSFCAFQCINGCRNDDSEFEDNEKGNKSGKAEGELVAIDKGFSFELDELLRASAYVLGKSGLGIVYKVVLGNGVPVAVRRLGGEGGEQRYKEFVAEVQAIGKVKHPNVVKLRAYYWAPDEKLLISDFISNGNLANAMRGRNGQPSTSLSWSIRLKIAKGAARGLAYLHECSPRKFVHGDVKPSNVLLDNEFQPYVSDFGLNRLISITGNNPDSSSGGFIGGLPYKSIQTERTNSYQAPEARDPGNRATQKWDVYSFGVVLLEMLTGKSPELSPTTSTSIEVPDLVRWVKKGFEEEKPLSDMVDPMLLQEAHAKKEVLAVFHVALACTEAGPEIRPRMKTVSENLERIGT